MSEAPATQPRPTQVTAAAWMIMVGSVFVVLTVWDRIAGLHSLDSQKALQKVLDAPGVQGSGLEMSDLMAIVKTVSMVGAGCATAMVILGYQALRRSRSARLALTVLAVPLFICGLVTGGFVAAVVVAAVGTLWLRPARLWFEGTPAARATASPSLQRHDQTPPLVGPPPAPPSSPSVPPRSRPQQQAPPAPPSWGAPPSPQAWGPPVWAPPPTSAYDVWPAPQSRPARRPGAVVGACVVTWVASALSLLTLLGSVVVLATDSGRVLASMHEQNPGLADQGVSDHMILVLAFVMCGVFVLWAVAALVVSVFCFRGRRWAWYCLLVSAVTLAAFSLLGVFASPVMLAPLAAAVVVVTLLMRPQARAWMR